MIQLWQIVGSRSSQILHSVDFFSNFTSAAKGNQMTISDIREISKVANVRIFVKKAIARIKWFRILKTQLPLLEMPLLDDIVICCCSLVNLIPPLTGG